MPRILPTASLRYAPRAGDPSHLLAPPYDVIDADEASRLRARSPYNAVRLILPEGGSPDRYAAAARTMKEWIEAGILSRSDRDASWIYSQAFRHGDRRFVRRALFAAVELVPFDRGQVLPHERTHRGPKEDRLALMTACRAQLSPVFLIARDPEGALGGLIQAAASAPPAIDTQTADGNQHRLHAVASELEGEILRAAGADCLLIADGHHRYETALGLAGRLAARPAAGAVLAAIVSQHDPGLLIQPTHRRLTGLPRGWQRDLLALFEAELGPSDPAALAAVVADAGPSAIGVASAPGASSSGLLLRVRSGAAADAGLSPTEAGLACLLFDSLILRRIMGLDADSAAAARALSYVQDPAAAPPGPDEGDALFLLPSVPVDRLWEVARHGRRLPPKSTFFSPKIPSGLLFRPL